MTNKLRGTMGPAEAANYNRIALTLNAPIYSFYANRILGSTGISRGLCLDVGCGGGYLGLALAGITALDFIFMDRSEAMLDHARQNIHDKGLAWRACTLAGEVQAIPLPDQAVDLVISRGSVGFWQDLPKAFAEVHRVLRPSGKAYIGGGLGPPELRERITLEMAEKEPTWGRQSHRPPIRKPGEYAQALREAAIGPSLVEQNDVGTWIQFTKT